MTAAIGHGFLGTPPARPAAGGTTARHGSPDSEKTAFGDLVHAPGQRGARTAPHRSDETKSASGAAGPRHRRDDATTPAAAAAGDTETARSGADKQAPKWTRPSQKAVGDGSPDDKTGDEQRPDASRAADAPPLRDRLPLLVTLNELGHRHGAEASPLPHPGPGGGERVNEPLLSGEGDGYAGHARAAMSPTAGEDASEFAAHAAARAAQGAPAEGLGEAATAAVAAALATRETGRPAQRDAPPTASGSTPARSGIAKDDPVGISRAPFMQLAATFEADEPPGTGEADDGGVGPARAEHGSARKNGSAPDPDPLSRNGSERQASGSATVTADRSFPAPAAHPLSTTTARVIEALAAAGNQTAARPVSQHPQTATVAHPAHMLRIELHPAELGTVVASLRMTGAQLSVELKPETAEAYRRLSNDSDAITKSLKKLGLDVDTVTVIQPSIATQPATRTDAGNQTSFLPGRDTPQFQSGTSGGGGDNFGGQQPGRNRGHDGQAPERPAPAHRQRAGGALFI
jgi:chemotaxis protein MotD